MASRNKNRKTIESVFGAESGSSIELNKFKLVFEFSPNAVLIIDKEGTIVTCNPRVTDFIGYTADEIAGLNIFSLPQLTPESLKKAGENLKKRLRGESVEPYILNFKTKSGSVKSGEVRANLISDNSKKIFGVMVTISDVTALLEQKRAVEESENKFRILSDTASSAIFIVKGEKFSYFNKSLEKISGYSADEIKSMNFWDMIHPDFRDLVRDRGLKRQRREDVENRYEFKIIAKDGTEKWVDFSASYVSFGGQPALIGTAFDITAKKNAVEEIKLNEEKYRQIFERAQIGLYRSNAEGKILMANDAFLNMLGYSSLDDFREIHFAIEGYVNPNAREDFINRVMKDGSIKNFEQVWRKKDGGIVYLRETAVYVEDEEGGEFFEGTVENVTEKKVAELALEEERKLLKMLMDNVPEAIYFKDAESKFIKVNKAFLKKHNFSSEEEVLGKTDYDLFSFEHAEKTMRDEEKIIQSKKPLIGIIEKETWRDGVISWVSSNKMPMFDNNGKVIGTFGISADITELKNSADEIERINRELKISNESKDKFFSIIAHDLRSPFTALLGYTEFIVEDFDSLTGEEIREYSNNVFVVAKNIFQLLENLLAWSRIQADRMECVSETIILVQVIDKVIDLFEAAAANKKIILKKEIGKKLIVSADMNMLFTILRNLVSNAIKFVNEGGTITITAGRNGGFAEISVIDNGVGIPEDKLSVIFDSDETFSTHGTNNESGTGLGLLLCKSMVEMNKGEIRVESEVGKGSKFSFTIPLDKDYIS